MKFVHYLFAFQFCRTHFIPFACQLRISNFMHEHFCAKYRGRSSALTLSADARQCDTHGSNTLLIFRLEVSSPNVRMQMLKVPVMAHCTEAAESSFTRRRLASTLAALSVELFDFNTPLTALVQATQSPRNFQFQCLLIFLYKE